MKSRKRTFFLLIALLAAGIFSGRAITVRGSAPAVGGQWSVDRLDDPALPAGSECTAAPNDCSLRGAVSAYSSADMITFEITGTIQLVQGELILANGDVTVAGPGAEALTISGGGTSRIFLTSPNTHVHISSVTLRDGFAEQGGAIFNNQSTLTLENCVLTENVASLYGGAIQNNSAVPSGLSAETPEGVNAANLVIHNCVLNQNTAVGVEEEDHPAQGGTTGIGGAIYNTAIGISSTAQVTITQSLIQNNSADDDFYAGGAIMNVAFNPGGAGTVNATLHIEDTTLSGNSAAYGDGGAIANYALDRGAAATVTLQRSTLSGNSSGSGFGGGGGVFNYAYNRDADGLTLATLNVFNSTLSDNAATMDRGGAIFNGALDSGSTSIVHAINSTFSGNHAANTGGAVANDAYNRNPVGDTQATVQLTHTTFVGNAATQGGAISNVPVNQVGVISVVDLKNSILLNSSGGDCLNSGTINGANNLIDDTTCGDASDFRIGAATLVELSLQNNGGPTATHALLAGSNAEDAVPVGDCTVVNTDNDLTSDQRGEPRPLGEACDIGSVEGTLGGKPLEIYLYLPVMIK